MGTEMVPRRVWGVLDKVRLVPLQILAVGGKSSRLLFFFEASRCAGREAGSSRKPILSNFSLSNPPTTWQVIIVWLAAFDPAWRHG
jgi:hypothetical protein